MVNGKMHMNMIISESAIKIITSAMLLLCTNKNHKIQDMHYNFMFRLGCVLGLD